MKMAFPYIMQDTFITITIGTKTFNIDNTHANFGEIKKAIRDNRWDEIERLINPITWIDARLKKELPETPSMLSVDFNNESVLYYGKPIHNTLTDRLFRMWSEGFNVAPMVLFLTNLLNNPSATAVNELYDFMETGNMPITEDGCFLAYKKVRANYTDMHTGTFDNSIGNVVEMPRNMVDDIRTNHCSTGLHFCSQAYLSQFNTNSDARIVIVKINPADVVSIPDDYAYTKGRCWKYTVYGEVELEVEQSGGNGFDSICYPSTPEPKVTPEPEVVLTADVVSPVELVVETTVEQPTANQTPFTMDMLGDLPNSILVKIYHILTGINLIKFRDKRTGVKKITECMYKNKDNSRWTKWAKGVITSFLVDPTLKSSLDTVADVVAKRYY